MNTLTGEQYKLGAYQGGELLFVLLEESGRIFTVDCNKEKWTSSLLNSTFSQGTLDVW